MKNLDITWGDFFLGLLIALLFALISGDSINDGWAFAVFVATFIASMFARSLS